MMSVSIPGADLLDKKVYEEQVSRENFYEFEWQMHVKLWEGKIQVQYPSHADPEKSSGLDEMILEADEALFAAMYLREFVEKGPLQMAWIGLKSRSLPIGRIGVVTRVLEARSRNHYMPKRYTQLVVCFDGYVLREGAAIALAVAFETMAQAIQNERESSKT
jgi:hypothetical protein